MLWFFLNCKQIDGGRFGLITVYRVVPMYVTARIAKRRSSSTLGYTMIKLRDSFSREYSRSDLTDSFGLLA
jgi:hypothetical protein